MNKQLFSKLKQAYASLGLGDEFLQAQADSLAALGLVTEENIENVVLSQKAFLESAQKVNDKRVTEAVKGKSAEAAKLQAQIEELQRKLQPTQPLDDFQSKFNAANAPMVETLNQLREQMKQMQEAATSQQADLAKLQEEKARLEQAQAAAQRQAKIVEKAKELKIPQYRIDEGFSIAANATDEEIGKYLTTVAGNIKNNSLPTNAHFAMSTKEPNKEEADALAAIIVGKS